MARLNFKEIDASTIKGNDSDQFEKFSKQFFEHALKMEVISGPSRGPDGGVDLSVLDKGANERLLVSCKHYAHSGKSVGRADEEDILDRLAEHNCDVFIGFYSTIASSGLEQKLERLKRNKKIKYKIYDNESIEAVLLDSVSGFHIAKRFFPDSIKNVWPQIISLSTAYSLDDATEVDSYKWVVLDQFKSSSTIPYASAAEDAVTIANEAATEEIHQPMFLAAWKDAVRLYPKYFSIPKEGIDEAIHWRDLPPKWEAKIHLDELRPNPRWTLLAIWSLIDRNKVREILKELRHDASQQDLDLMSFQWLAESTATERRDILTRLFAYYCV
ncbi:restriction endonuclease [Parashewanella tropica]|uniref:restriction endonuclease n=1 Tax=Parashewanella tropica TaxID=2547970 RepID=UPI00105A99CE|nr:restriction endonuclease [Parashewanella tropica]